MNDNIRRKVVIIGGSGGISAATIRRVIAQAGIAITVKDNREPMPSMDEIHFGRALRIMPKECERYVTPEKDLDRPQYQKPAFRRGKGQRNKSWQF